MPSRCARRRRTIGNACSTPAPTNPPDRFVYLWSLDETEPASARTQPCWAPMRLFTWPRRSKPRRRRRSSASIWSRAARNRLAPHHAGGGGTGAGHRPVARGRSTSIRTSPAAASTCPRERGRRPTRRSGTSCCGRIVSGRSPSAARRATSSASAAACPRPSAARSRGAAATRIARARAARRAALRARSRCPPAGAGEVLIEVKAAGMNFRDVLKALALYPGGDARTRASSATKWRAS